MYIYNPNSFLKMQPHILPVSIPSSSSPSSSSSSSSIIMPLTSATADTLLLRSEDDDRSSSTGVLISSSSFEDDKKIEIKPFLPRSSSYDGSGSVGAGTSSFNFFQKRRRRTASDSSLSTSDEKESFGQNVGRAASNTFLITRFSFEMLRYLGVGYKWITRFLALGCYAVLLIPGFVQVAYYYYFSSQVRRDIVYGDQPRNKLDLYLPRDTDGPKPVIGIITGGAWIIGYKAWGSLLGKHLSERDIIVACIDYRNFPQVTIGDMVKDASQGISFLCNNISEYGGDPNRIYLMGQSAGAHIAACALVEQAIKGSGEGESASWSVSQINAYFGLSGGYNLPNLVDHFHSRGLNKSLLFSIMEGEESLRRYSPDLVVQDPNNKNAISLLPPIILFHGTADYSIPSDSSKTFVDTLQRLGLKAESVLYEGRTHTDLFLQDPMRGDDEMFEDIVTYIHAGDPQALAKHAAAPRRKRLVPELMLKLARKVSPF